MACRVGRLGSTQAGEARWGNETQRSLALASMFPKPPKTEQRLQARDRLFRGCFCVSEDVVADVDRFRGAANHALPSQGRRAPRRRARCGCKLAAGILSGRVRQGLGWWERWARRPQPVTHVRDVLRLELLPGVPRGRPVVQGGHPAQSWDADSAFLSARDGLGRPLAESRVGR